MPSGIKSLNEFTMAHRRSSRRTESSTDPALAAKAQRMITKLCHYHAVGRKANASNLSTVELAAEYGLSVSTMRKAREFAREYSPSDLARLCRCRRGEPSKGIPLHWGHVQYLLTAEKKDRAEFEVQACKNNWTDLQLYAAIRSRRTDSEPRRSGGRAVRPPTSYLGCAQRLLLDGRPWIRRADAMLENFPVAKASELNARGRQQLEEAVRILVRMKQLAGALAKRLEQDIKD
jgi:hypothetical protein